MTGSRKNNYYAILMAGGVGSRFWPSSKASHPKQFIDILGVGETLFQTTFRRLAKLIPAENIFVLTNKNYVGFIREQIPEIQEEQIVPEPEMRNTAPSILLGAMKIETRNPNALTVVAPSDHWIEDEDEFLENIRLAFDEAGQQDKLISLGIRPSFPNTGYGYIKYDLEDSNTFKKVERFVEKPHIQKAREFLKSGNYAWNAGIFVWSTKFIIDSFKQYLPEMYELFAAGSEIWNTAEEHDFLEENYGKAENISIDYGIMEKSDSVYLLPVSFRWNDLGTWSSVQGELASDDDGNTSINARLHAEDAHNNIISTFDKKIVALKDLSDYIIVDDQDVLLIVPKEKEQEIKRIREEIMKDFGNDLG